MDKINQLILKAIKKSPKKKEEESRSQMIIDFMEKKPKIILS